MKNTNHPLLYPCAIVAVSIVCSMSGQAADAKDPIIYQDLVNPILQAKCVACHGEEKSKGKLRLDTYEAAMKGGSDAGSDNIIPGKPAESEAIVRVHLPLDDDDHMPPEDKGQLTKQELLVLEFWIKSGAKKDMKLSEAKPAGADAEAVKFVIANPPKIKAKKSSKPTVDPKVVAALATALADVMPLVEKSGASLMAIAQDTPELRFSALNVAKDFKDGGLKILQPVSEQILWLDLARTQITDQTLADVAAMKNLTRLHLENTKITDAGLANIAKLGNLEYLNLYGTQVTDAGIQKLAGLKKLKKIFLWETKVTDAGAKQLAAQIPGLDANTGFKAAAVKPVLAATATPAPAKPAPTPAPKPAATPPAPPTPNAVLAKALASAKAAADSASKAAADATNAAKAAQQLVKEAEAALDALNKKADTPPQPAVAKPTPKPDATPAAPKPAEKPAAPKPAANKPAEKAAPEKAGAKQA